MQRSTPKAKVQATPKAKVAMQRSQSQGIKKKAKLKAWSLQKGFKKNVFLLKTVVLLLAWLAALPYS